MREQRRTRWPHGLYVLMGLVMTLGGEALAQDATQLATRLSALRGEVESLSAELGEKQADYRAQLQGYARQEADLALEARRGQTAIAKTRLAIQTLQQKNAEKETAGKVLDPVLNWGVDQMERYVSTSLPFKSTARLQALTEIREQRKTKSLSVAQAMNRFWAFVEDEMRMQRESVVHRQEIHLDGQAVLADVLRVGMVMMFFRVKDRGVGYVKKTENGWTYVESSNAEEVKQIELAFEQFQKQVRVGTFVLPNQTPAVEDDQ